MPFRGKVSRSSLADYETAVSRPPLIACKEADKHFGTNDHFQVMAHHAMPKHRPQWFQEYAGKEPQARHIRIFQPIIVPGLFQVDGYTRAIYAAAGEPDIDALVAERIKRQEILTRTDPAPPHVWAVLDELALMRPYGGRVVMRAQFEHLLAVSELPHVHLQVIPVDTGEYIGSAYGGFLVLDLPDAPVAYSEAHNGGRLAEVREEVAVFQLRWSLIQVNALSVDSSRQLIRTHLERYT